ncbi:MAG: hypothetical protein JXR84_04255 [Anaerolineae bacterium]|nr:hypothetical protein [Anaerolineae bacterium]
MVKVVQITAIVVLLTILGVVSVGAQGPGESPVPTPTLTPTVEPGPIDPGTIQTLPDLLEMLAGPAGWVMLGAFFSSLLASWAWYNEQGDAVKRGIPVALAVVVSILARLLVTYVPASFWEGTAEYWYILAGIVATWLGSQGWFKAVVKPARG